MKSPSIAAAKKMGESGSPVVPEERLAFEAWMQGHCWALGAEWTGSGYRASCETGTYIDPQAMCTRMMWAAWRDRAALSLALD